MKSIMKGSHKFSETPHITMPRSSFDRSHGLKTTMDAGYLVPIFVDEALPGDTLNLNPSVFARLSTPINPVMDNLYLDTHFFAVPIRQIWENFRKFCGEQANPSDSTDYLVPEMTSDATYLNGTLFDYMGLPTNQPAYKHSALFLRAYNHIFNEWFRDQNLQDSVPVPTGDGPDPVTNYTLLKRGKRHDYFTSCLPFLQKGDAVSLPLGSSAAVTYQDNPAITNSALGVQLPGLPGVNVGMSIGVAPAPAADIGKLVPDPTTNVNLLVADLTNATASTVNELRLAFQIQKLLERDARGGTRYAEIVKSHFGVQFMDVTYRPEFLGGTSTPINFHSVPQTSETGTTPQGNLSSFATASSGGGGFTKSFTEHNIIIGLASVRADLTYQQGLDRMWSRRTRYDFYWPALAHIGEQAVLNKEIYLQGTAADDDVFGYQERWAEYRYKPSKITGKFRSNDATSLDPWHLSQEFSTLPGLNSAFIQETPPMDRVLAIPAEPDLFLDFYFNYRCARPIPLYSVPGLIDHF